eukprot:2489926-Rhodomonas_salina.4
MPGIRDALQFFHRPGALTRPKMSSSNSWDFPNAYHKGAAISRVKNPWGPINCSFRNPYSNETVCSSLPHNDNATNFQNQHVCCSSWSLLSCFVGRGGVPDWSGRVVSLRDLNRGSKGGH